VLVAAAILVVFFVPLPRISLFNRLSHGNTVTPGGSSTTSIPGSKGTTPFCSNLSLALGPQVSPANEEIP